MSIVKYVKDELPKDETVVYCDNGNFSSDRAIFKGGKFIGGGEYPQRAYEMTHVTKWFDYDAYLGYHRAKGGNCFSLCFEVAENIKENL